MPNEKDYSKVAYQDYLNGMKLKDIAEKYNIPLNTVKSWKYRKWQKWDADAKLQPDNSKVATNDNTGCGQKRKKGGQPGNKNAVGNKGKPQPGNKNHWVHGIYEKIVYDTLPDEVKELFNEKEVDPRNEIILAMRICDTEIIRLLGLIKKAEEKAGGVHIDRISKTDVKNGEGENSKYKSTTTKTISSNELILRYRNEIQKYLKLKTKCIDTFCRMDIDDANKENMEHREQVNEDRLLIEKTKLKVLIQRVTGKIDLDNLIDDDVAELLEDIDV